MVEQKCFHKRCFCFRQSVKMRAFKEELYKKMGLTVVGTTATDLEDVTRTIDRILLQYPKK